MQKRVRAPQAGFSLLELAVSMAILVVIAAAGMSLLNTAQTRYRSEQQQLDSLQGARVGVDQLTRDIHRAGYPPVNSFVAGVNPAKYAIPFVGIVSGAVNQNCTIAGGATPCTVPGPFALVIETFDDTAVKWIYYQLKVPFGSTTCTLYRNVTTKSVLSSPTITGAVPMVENVINKSDGTCNTTTGTALFTYSCDSSHPAPCNAQDIGEVLIQLQAKTYAPDAQTGQYPALTLRSLARRMNPAQ